MSEKVSLNIEIGGRSYPLKINKGEEAGIKKASDDINRAIDILKKNYAVKDMQDLMAMASLQLLLNPKEGSQKVSESDGFLEINEAIRLLDEELSSME